MYLDHPGPIPFAHRGGAAEAPENTMTAFDRAVQMGYRHLETDARITRDGVLVAFHDPDLRRLSQHPFKVSDLTWAELSKLKVLGEPIPRMEELLSTWPEINFNIDPKQDECIEPLAHLLKTQKAVHRIGIGAFSGIRLKRLREIFGPDLVTSASPVEIAALRFKPLPKSVDYRCLQIPIRFKGVKILTRGLRKRARQLGLQIHIWTIDDSPTINKLIDLGIDGIMTDRPHALKEVLIHRNLWKPVE